MVPFSLSRSLSTALLLGLAGASPVTSPPFRTLVGGDVTLRILPLGDSLTYGSPSAPLSFRATLASLLEADGNAVTTVGTTRHGSGPHSGVEASAADQRLDELRARAEVAVPGFLPNIVLVNGGTADCEQAGYGADGADGAGERAEGILRTSWAKSRAASAVLSTVLPRDGASGEVAECVRGVNEQLRDLVVAMQAISKKVVLVDFAGEGAGIEVGGDGFPTEGGYGRMAEMWFAGIADAAGRGWVQKPEELPRDAPVAEEEEVTEEEGTNWGKTGEKEDKEEGTEGGKTSEEEDNGPTETKPAAPVRPSPAEPTPSDKAGSDGAKPSPAKPTSESPGGAADTDTDTDIYTEKAGAGTGEDDEGGAARPGPGVTGVVVGLASAAVGFGMALF